MRPAVFFTAVYAMRVSFSAAMIITEALMRRAQDNGR